MRQIRRINQAVLAIAALLVLAVVVSASILVAQNKNTALSDRQRETTYLLNSAEASINRSLLSVDLLLAQTGNLLAMMGAPKTSAIRPADNTQPTDGVNELLRSLATQNLLVQHLSILRRDGTIMLSSDGNGKRLGFALPAPFLQDILAQPAPALSLSSPVSYLESDTTSTGISGRVTASRPTITASNSMRLLVVWR